MRSSRENNVKKNLGLYLKTRAGPYVNYRLKIWKIWKKKTYWITIFE